MYRFKQLNINRLDNTGLCDLVRARQMTETMISLLLIMNISASTLGLVNTINCYFLQTLVGQHVARASKLGV